jgi:hypothetical protein
MIEYSSNLILREMMEEKKNLKSRDFQHTCDENLLKRKILK